MTQPNVIRVDFVANGVRKTLASMASRKRDVEDLRAALHELGTSACLFGLDLQRELTDGQLAVATQEFLARMDGCGSVVAAVLEQLLERLEKERGAS